MSENKILKQYKKELDYSYASGAYATIEMIKVKPDIIREIYLHSKYNDTSGMESLCFKNKIPCIYNDKSFDRINQKENSYVIGVFNKYFCGLSCDKPHIVLVNPGDMGNLGTIVRTMAGLNITELAIITPAADIFDPKTIRSSMGALFHINFKLFSSFEEYQEMFPMHNFFPFLLDGGIELDIEGCPKTQLFSLIFGNEATGLPRQFANIGTSIRIPFSLKVDSFNLAISAGIGMFVFANRNELI